MDLSTAQDRFVGESGNEITGFIKERNFLTS